MAESGAREREAGGRAACDVQAGWDPMGRQMRDSGGVLAAAGFAWRCRNGNEMLLYPLRGQQVGWREVVAAEGEQATIVGFVEPGGWDLAHLK